MTNDFRKQIVIVTKPSDTIRVGSSSGSRRSVCASFPTYTLVKDYVRGTVGTFASLPSSYFSVIFNNRTQTKCAKVMFLHLSVSHSVHKGRGICLSACWDSRHPQEQTPPQQTPPGADPSRSRQTPPAQCTLGDTSNKRQYASYWNAYLLFIIFQFKILSSLHLT